MRLRSFRSGHGEPHRCLGVSSGADVPSDRSDSSSGFDGAVPSGHLEDAAGHRDQGDHDCED